MRTATEAIITLSKNGFLCNDYATNNPDTVTVYVNVGGVIDSCTSIVTIIDTIPPTVSCPQSDLLDITCDEFNTLYGGSLDTYIDSIKVNDYGFGVVEDNCFAQGSIYYEESYELIISSVNSCGYGDFQLQYKVTDTLSGLADSCTIIITITNSAEGIGFAINSMIMTLTIYIRQSTEHPLRENIESRQR